MNYGPDFSDSGSDQMSDDGDYVNFKNKVGNPEVIKDYDVHAKKKKNLQNALACGDLDAVITIVKDGVDINEILEDSWAPLHLSAAYGNPILTKALIEMGANVNVSRGLANDVSTPLMMACLCPKTTSPFDKSLEVAQLLVQAGADVTIGQIEKKRNALMCAAYSGNLELVRYLIPLSDINYEDNKKWTALYWAVLGNHPEVVQYFLDENWDYNITDIRENSPLDIAKRHDFQKITKIFTQESVELFTETLLSENKDFEETFSVLKKGEKPKLFLDVCNILSGLRAESATRALADRNIGLYEFLSLSNEDLKEMGIHLPFQRNRILGAMYRFHKRPFLPNSVRKASVNNQFSNKDIAVQILAAIKHLIVMEAALDFIIKHYNDEKVFKSELPLTANLIHKLKRKIFFCKAIVEDLKKKTIRLDNKIKPADLITSETKTYFLPWRKIIFTFSAVSVILGFKMMK